MAGRRLRQLVRHDPGQHGLLPGAVAPAGPPARARHRDPSDQAGHRPHARRPPDGHLDQRLLLTVRPSGWLGSMDLDEKARARYDGILAVAREVVVGLDFDGTLAPIVEDPARAVIHPDAPAALAAL